MFSRLRCTTFFALAACPLLVGARALLATPSGLNNIPTSDVTPEGVLVFQTFANFGSNQPSRYTGGFKFGPAVDWEVGYDGRISQTGTGTGVTGAGGAPTHGATFQIKRRLRTKDDSLSFALGLANLSFSTDRAGNPAGYLVGSKSLEKCNLHLGYAAVRGNDNLFAGIDVPTDSGLTLRFDFNNLSRTTNLLSSAGFIYPVDDQWVVEGWWSNSRAAGVNDTITLKLNYVVPLK